MGPPNLLNIKTRNFFHHLGEREDQDISFSFLLTRGVTTHPPFAPVTPTPLWDLMEPKLGAGILLYRLQRTPEFLLIHDSYSPRRHWTPPKGYFFFFFFIFLLPLRLLV